MVNEAESAPSRVCAQIKDIGNSQAFGKHKIYHRVTLATLLRWGYSINKAFPATGSWEEWLSRKIEKPKEAASKFMLTTAASCVC